MKHLIAIAIFLSTSSSFAQFTSGEMTIRPGQSTTIDETIVRCENNPDPSCNVAQSCISADGNVFSTTGWVVRSSRRHCLTGSFLSIDDALGAVSTFANAGYCDR